MRVLYALLLVLLASTPLAYATELGVNYYMESMVSQQWQVPYIPRTVAQVDQDFDHISTVSRHVKFYMNPFVDSNLGWVETLVQRADAKGLHTVVNMMVDDRQINDANWGDYTSRVLTACSRLSGKADVLLVGNEIMLHSPWDKWTERAKVEPLINSCKSRFAGEVSYEAFWYSKDAWVSYPGKLYFMQYENLNSFTFNVNEMRQLFGSRAMIGEWGEDSIDESTPRDDWWQRLQIESRWNVIEDAQVPIAYIYTYREPSWNGFGIIRPDGLDRPVWDFLETLDTTPPACVPTTEVCDGNDDDCDGQVDEGDVCAPPGGGAGGGSGDGMSVADLQISCQASGCALISDAVSGACRTVRYSSSQGEIKVQGCDKTDGYVELYKQAAPSNFAWKVCFGNGCVSKDNGFARFLPVYSPPACVPTTEVCDGNDDDCDGQVDEGGVCDTGGSSGGSGGPWDGNIASLSTSCTASGQSCGGISDVTSGVCRTIRWSTSSGEIRIQACKKSDGYVEVYKQLAPASIQYQACVSEGCVSRNTGFARFLPQSGPTGGGGDTGGGGGTGGDTGGGTGTSYTLATLPMTSQPSGTKTQDTTSGTCRTVVFSTSSGTVQAKVCDKGANYEMYLQTPGSQASVCTLGHCVGPTAGFASFDV